MKNKILLLFASLFMLSSFVACEYEVKDYNDGSGVYFDAGTGSASDTISFSWIYYNSDIQDEVYNLRVMTFGRQTNVDRVFSIEIVPERDEVRQAVAGIDYEAFKLDYIIPANHSFVDIPIKILRNPILMEEGVNRLLTVRLKENENFKLIYDRTYTKDLINEAGDTTSVICHIDTYRTFKIGEVMTRQVWWSAEPYSSGNKGYDWFGNWSAKKSLLICDWLKLDRKEWLEGATSDGLFLFYARKMQQLLLEAEASGNMVWDDVYDMPMEMGPKAQL